MTDSKPYIKNITKIWRNRIFLSVFDQAAFSGAHFLINLLLARWLQPSDYGEFSIAFTFLLLSSGLQIAFVTEPMTIFGPKYYIENISLYLGRLVYFQILISILGSLVLILISFFFEGAVRNSILIISISFPLIMIFWFLRQACYIRLNPGHAFGGSFIYLLSILSLSITIKNFWYLSSEIAYLIISISSIFSTLFLMIISKLKFINVFSQFKQVKLIIQQNYHYGKWIIIAFLFDWITTSLFIPLLDYFSGPEEVAAYRAILNLVLPLQQILRAIYLLLLPWLSINIIGKNQNEISSITKKILLALFCLILVYSVIIIMFAANLVDLIYDNTFYQGYLWLLSVFLINLTIITVSDVIGLLIRIFERSKAILLIKGFPAIFNLSFGLLIMYYLEIRGIMINLIILSLISTIISLIYFSKIFDDVRSEVSIN